MNQHEAEALAARLDTEAEYAARSWDHAWNGGVENEDDRDKRFENGSE